MIDMSTKTLITIWKCFVMTSQYEIPKYNTKNEGKMLLLISTTNHYLNIFNMPKNTIRNILVTSFEIVTSISHIFIFSFPVFSIVGTPYEIGFP